MTQHLKLSLWDAFAFFLSGWAVCVSAYIHFALLGFNVNDYLGKIPPTGLGFAAFLVPLIVGLLFEPVGNKLGGLILWVGGGVRLLAGKVFKTIDASSKNQTDPLIERTKESIPFGLSGSVRPYHWAKDYLAQEEIETPYMAFLSKFGFYRNIGSLLIINAVLVPGLYGFGKSEKILFFTLIVASLLYFVRSQRFYRHLGESVFRNYVILQERKIAEETSKE